MAGPCQGWQGLDACARYKVGGSRGGKICPCKCVGWHHLLKDEYAGLRFSLGVSLRSTDKVDWECQVCHTRWQHYPSNRAFGKRDTGTSCTPSTYAPNISCAVWCPGPCVVQLGVLFPSCGLCMNSLGLPVILGVQSKEQ